MANFGKIRTIFEKKHPGCPNFQRTPGDLGFFIKTAGAKSNMQCLYRSARNGLVSRFYRRWNWGEGGQGAERPQPADIYFSFLFLLFKKLSTFFLFSKIKRPNSEEKHEFGGRWVATPLQLSPPPSRKNSYNATARFGSKFQPVKIVHLPNVFSHTVIGVGTIFGWLGGGAHLQENLPQIYVSPRISATLFWKLKSWYFLKSKNKKIYLRAGGSAPSDPHPVPTPMHTVDVNQYCLWTIWCSVA